MKSDVLWISDGHPIRSAEELISYAHEHPDGVRIGFWRNQRLREITLEGGN